jgi:uncharacterized radical SAM protein YgiQ
MIERKITDWLPTTRKEAQMRGWDEMDVVIFSGDAYVDHPSFGCAIITRLLEAHGFKVGIIAQPDWRNPSSIDVFGEPRLGFMVSAGNMDSMVNHYTVAKRRRSKDFYSPGGKMGLRPDHAVVVYGNLIRRTYKHTPIILGGIEASLRRLAHYDYWSDSLKRSVLLDAGADLISYGMGEHSIIEIAEDSAAKNISTNTLPSLSKLESVFLGVFFSLFVKRQARKTAAQINTHIHIMTRHPERAMMSPPSVGPKITAALDISI